MMSSLYVDASMLTGICAPNKDYVSNIWLYAETPMIITVYSFLSYY